MLEFLGEDNLAFNIEMKSMKCNHSVKRSNRTPSSKPRVSPTWVLTWRLKAADAFAQHRKPQLSAASFDSCNMTAEGSVCKLFEVVISLPKGLSESFDIQISDSNRTLCWRAPHDLPLLLKELLYLCQVSPNNGSESDPSSSPMWIHTILQTPVSFVRFMISLCSEHASYGPSILYPDLSM